MDTNKILSADLLDLIFDDRNKEYGAYDLRKNYHVRITKSLVFTGVFITLIFTGVVLANKLEPQKKSLPPITTVTLLSIPEEKEPEPIPESPEKPKPIESQTEPYTQIKIVANIDVIEPPPTQIDLDSARIGVARIKGTPDLGIESSQPLNEGISNSLFEEKRQKNPRNSSQ